MTGATRFPLSWPAGAPRTPAHKRQRPKFKTATFAQVRDGLLAELRRAGATGVVLSTNVELRQDGLPYSGRRNPDDPGAAVYFTRKGRPHCIKCDHWLSVEENLRAITDVIEAIRLIERRGTGEMVDAAFSGFAQLPAAGRFAESAPNPLRGWWVVLGVPGHASTDEVQAAYRRRAKEFHPDRNPGDQEAARMYQEVDAAYDQFKRERGL